MMTTSIAGTGGAIQFNHWVRLRTQAAEDAAKPKPQQPGLSDFEMDYEKRQAEKIAAEKRDIASGRLKIL
jgi:hypothetical protein